MTASNDIVVEINNMLNKDFNYLERKKISSLKINEAYLIRKLVPMVTRFGKTILATLYDKTDDVVFETFLPKRIAEIITENNINIMNSSHKYTLTYLGQSSHSYAGHTKSLLNFGCLE